jgi:hypothetical protein
LTARQRNAFIANGGIVALWQGRYEVVDVCVAADVMKLVVCEVFGIDAEKNVLFDSS